MTTVAHTRHLQKRSVFQFLVAACQAHLAGALGRLVWVALKKDAEWRWLRARDDSPWYPTMRLFRQKQYGEWRHVFDAMAAVIKS